MIVKVKSDNATITNAFNDIITALNRVTVDHEIYPEIEPIHYLARVIKDVGTTVTIETEESEYLSPAERHMVGKIIADVTRYLHELYGYTDGVEFESKGTAVRFCPDCGGDGSCSGDCTPGRIRRNNGARHDELVELAIERGKRGDRR